MTIKSIVANPTSDIQLVHPFKDIIPDVDEFFQAENEVGAINTINALCYKIKKLSDKYSLQIDENKFKGDALELFVEFLIKTNASDNRIGIYEYHPIDVTEDVGVDGYGIGENGNPATVQVKYRAGDYVLTANEDHLSNLLTGSIFNYSVKPEDDKNMLIITTGLKVHETTREKMLKNKVRVLNREALREMLDNRPEWWIRFYEAVKASRIQKQTIPAITLREHQIEAVINCMKDTNRKGKVILPTGTGKTLIEAELIYRAIIEQQNPGVVPIIKVNSSRILLCFQLFEEVFGYLSSNGITARYVNYNSGNADDKYYIAELRKMGGVYREITSTTSCKEVVESYENAVKENLPLIVFSTYHSSEKFSGSGLVPHLTIHDEAHNLVSNEFFKAATLPSGANFYFTATEKVTDGENGLGMNNKDIFDDIIYSQSPKTMIGKGEMVPPYIHIVRAKDGQKINLDKLDNDYDALVSSIENAFHAHETQIKKISSDPDELGAKVLVVCRGQQDLIEMFTTKVFDNFKTNNPDIHIFALSSDFGLYNDGDMQKSPVTNVKKFQFLKKVKSLASNEKAIIFHVDMIGEGIDVPGITGVMPFRNCELAKFVQNIGRASRLHKNDRKRMYAGEISPSDRSTWIKPCSWVIIPDFLENSEGFASRFKEIICELRTNYGYIPRQHTVIDNVKGLADDEEIDKVNDKIKNRPHSDSGLEDFEHIIEDVMFDDDVEQARLNIRAELTNLLGFVHDVPKEAEKTSVMPLETIEDVDIEIIESAEFKLLIQGLNARMVVRNDKFVILVGSDIRSWTNPSIMKGYGKLRDQLIKDGFIENWKVVKEIICNSPSQAVSIIVGGNMNGKHVWRNEFGTVGKYLDL
jgi:superfamily II DNA or RNA helicase